MSGFVSPERLQELGEQHIEVLPDDADPNAPDFRREVTMQQAGEAGDGAEAWWVYTCLHYFIWRGELYCRICGCRVLPGWMWQHRDKMHGFRGFGGF